MEFDTSFLEERDDVAQAELLNRVEKLRRQIIPSLTFSLALQRS
jgi:hypothetical protein